MAFKAKQAREQTIIINYEAKRKVIKAETGQSFLKMLNFGTVPDHIKEVYLNNYPGSALGILQYNNNQQTTYGCGCLIGQNVVLTCTPQFANNQDIKGHEQFILSYLKSKLGKRSFPKNEIDQRKQDSDEQVQSQELNVQQILSVDDRNAIYYIPSNQPQSKIRAKVIHYPQIKQHLPLHFRKNLPFVSLQFALIQLEFDQNLQQKYGTIGYNFRNPSFSTQFNENMTLSLVFNYELQSWIYTNDETDLLIGSPIVEKWENSYLVIGLYGLKHHFTQEMFVQMQQFMYRRCQKIFFQDFPLNAYKPSVLHETIYKHRPNLTYLKLNSCNIELINFMQIQTNPKDFWFNLRTLNLTRNKLGYYKIIRIIVSISCPHLVQIFLNETQLLDYQIRQLSKGLWPNLSHISLAKNELTESCLHSLISGRWLDLSALTISFHSKTNTQIMKLMIANWENLSMVNLQSRLRPEFIELLHKKFAKLWLQQ